MQPWATPPARQQQRTVINQEQRSLNMEPVEYSTNCRGSGTSAVWELKLGLASDLRGYPPARPPQEDINSIHLRGRASDTTDHGHLSHCELSLWAWLLEVLKEKPSSVYK